MIRKPIFYIAVICMILSAALLILSFSYNDKFEKVSITTEDGIILTGRLYTGTLDQCIVICHGFSSDFTNAYRLKSIFHDQGYGVLLFDFTGHGASGGTVTFDNAQTDRLSNDIENAVAFLIEIGYEPENIILAGHSMGARSIMQYAVFNMNHGPLVLIGPEINLNENKQASFFTGAVDTEMPFVKSMSGTNPDSPILIITSDWDDISPIESSTLLFEELGGGSSGRKLVVVPSVLHNYEMFSARVIKETLEWTNGLYGHASSSSGTVLLITLYGWIAGLALAFITPLLFHLSLRDSGRVIKETPAAVQTTKFVLMKILIWLLGILAGAVIIGIIFIIPMGKPLFSVQFIAIVGGYGLVSILFYRIGKMPGHKTKLRIFNSSEKVTAKQATLGLIILVAFCSLSFLARASGLNKVFTDWQNITWHFLFAFLMSLGFLVLGRESDIISANATKPYQKVLWNIVKYFPFYIFAVFYLAIGSLSGLAGAIQGLAFLFYAIYAGKVVYSVSGSTYLPAICTAIILAVPTGAIF